jgi:hypothetical protein
VETVRPVEVVVADVPAGDVRDAGSQYDRDAFGRDYGQGAQLRQGREERLGDARLQAKPALEDGRQPRAQERQQMAFLEGRVDLEGGEQRSHLPRRANRVVRRLRGRGGRLGDGEDKAEHAVLRFAANVWRRGAHVLRGGQGIAKDGFAQRTWIRSCGSFVF